MPTYITPEAALIRIGQKWWGKQQRVIFFTIMSRNGGLWSPKRHNSCHWFGLKPVCVHTRKETAPEFVWKRTEITSKCESRSGRLVCTRISLSFFTTCTKGLDQQAKTNFDALKVDQMCQVLIHLEKNKTRQTWNADGKDERKTSNRHSREKDAKGESRSPCTEDWHLM